ncbi:hypothetical protein LP419_19955 [Massilia sp. H-1]|nr:hypothetical protein LP419_19955 [Massilia sp. H-1]
MLMYTLGVALVCALATASAFWCWSCSASPRRYALGATMTDLSRRRRRPAGPARRQRQR